MSREEEAFLTSLQAPRLKACTPDVILPELRYLAMSLGIRSENMPNKQEIGFMISNLQEHHGNITIKELHLAFEMAVSLKLDFNPHAYQNLSILYVNELLAAYKRWSVETYKTIRPDSIMENEQEQAKWSPEIYERKPINHFRADIQQGYDNFLNGVLSQYAYIPYDWWHVLCDDGYIEHDPDACVRENKRFNDLTAEDKRKLRNSQQMVWLLFEMAQQQRRRNIYIQEP